MLRLRVDGRCLFFMSLFMSDFLSLTPYVREVCIKRPFLTFRPITVLNLPYVFYTLWNTFGAKIPP